MRILLAGGGTAGHINPALAIARAAKTRFPHCEVRFVGSRQGMERDLVTREGYELFLLDVAGLQGKNPLRLANVLLKAGRSVAGCKRYLKENPPDLVIGTGGYVSFPVLWAAQDLHIPTVIHEQNAFPGKTSRILARRADRVMISFEQSRAYFPHPDRLVLTGNPLRGELLAKTREQARRELAMSESAFFVLSFAGSLGAREINRAMIEVFRLLKDCDDLHWIHATGERGWQWVPDQLKQVGVNLIQHPNLEVKPYLYNMPTMMAAADLVVCRAGAITLSELAAQHKPSILIPSPNVANNHQHFNALAFEQAGAARILPESELCAERLLGLVKSLRAAPEELKRMQHCAQELAVYNASDRIIRVIKELIFAEK